MQDWQATTKKAYSQLAYGLEGVEYSIISRRPIRNTILGVKGRYQFHCQNTGTVWSSHVVHPGTIQLFRKVTKHVLLVKCRLID